MVNLLFYFHNDLLCTAWIGPVLMLSDPPPQPAPAPTPPPVQAEPQQDNDLEMFELDDSGFEKEDLDDFTFDFADDMADFSWDLTVDEDEKKKADDAEATAGTTSASEKKEEKKVGYRSHRITVFGDLI